MLIYHSKPTVVSTIYIAFWENTIYADQEIRGSFSNLTCKIHFERSKL